MANPFFNAKYYLEKNADVAAAVSDDADLAEQHYFLHGASEALNDGLVARQPAPWFDIEFYANSREDLADVPAEQLFLHFVLHGMREGLSPMEGVEFDADTYLAANEDLVEGLNIADPESLTEDEALLLQQHFFAHGYHEGRDGGPEIPGYDPDEPDTDRGELADALQELLDANTALADFLKENGEDGEPTTPEAIREAVKEAENELKEKRETESDAKLAADVIKAEADLSVVQDAFDSATKPADFRAAVASYRKESAKLETLVADLETKEKAAQDQFKAFKDANPKKKFNENPQTDGALWDLTAVDFDALEDDDYSLNPEGDNAPEGAVLLAFYVGTHDHGGQVVLISGVNEKDYPGITDFFNATNAALSASIAVEEQKEVVTTKRGEVTDASPDPEGEEQSLDALFQEVLDAEATLEAAEQAVVEREKLVKAVADAKALVEELEELEDAVDAAVKALEELGYENVEVAEGTLVTSGEGDIFLFNEADAEITGFGEEADDVIFFDVSEYTFNADGVDAGDNNVLEVFLVQEGDDVHVLFEQEAYGSATEQFHTIVLVGTDLDSVQVDDLGFISL